MGEAPNTLRRFYELLDEGADTGSLLSLVHPELVFEISLPERTVAGGLPEFRSFLEQRAGRRGGGCHELLSWATSGRFDHLTGQLVVGDAPPSLFFATARRGADGRLRTYFMRRSGIPPTPGGPPHPPTPPSIQGREDQ